MWSSDGKLLTTWFPITIVILVSVLVFLPTCFNYQYNFNGDKLQDSMNGEYYLHSVSIAIGASIPMLLEIMMDYKDFPLHILIPKLFIACGLLIPNSIFLFSSRTSMTLYLNAYQARSTLIAGGLLVSLFDSGNTLTHKLTVLITTSTCAAYMIVSAWGIDRNHSALGIALYILNILCVAEALLISLWYGKRVIQNWSDVLKSTLRKTTLIHSILISTYAVAFVCVGSLFGSKGWGQTGSNELIVYTFVDVIVAVIAITVPSRLVRKESYKIKHTLESKKHFVRYVSHEMRTPLNTVCVGLQLVDKYLLALEEEIEEILTKASATMNEGINHIKLLSLQDLKAVIEDISLSCTTSIDILNDLLVYDQVEEGHLILKLQKVRLVECLKSISKPFQLQALESGVEFTFMGYKVSSSPIPSSLSIAVDEAPEDDDSDISISDVVVCIDTLKIAQVIRNLLSNAFKYTLPGGSVQVRARIITRDDTPIGENNTFVRIEIQDSGSGVSLENQVHLFTSVVSFHTDNVENTKEGSGLGLYISNAIVKKHGGIIGVISAGIPGGGSTFYVDLPLACDTDTKDHEEIRLSTSHDAKKVVPHNILLSMSHSIPHQSDSQTTLIPTSSTSFCNPPLLQFKCALVVDDSTMTRKMLVKSISNYFDIILQGSDGVEAVNIIKSQFELGTIPNVVFLDSIMPNMSGIDACREIRALGYTGVIIAVTGNVLPSDIEEFLSAGADKLVPKPFKIDEIKSTLEGLLGHCSPLYINRIL